MSWQDITIAIVNIFLSYALIPQIIHNFKNKKNGIKLQTSIITTLGLYVLTFTLFTLGLILSASITAIAGTLWLIILIQKIIYK